MSKDPITKMIHKLGKTCDVDYIIEKTIFECLIFFWEVEKGGDNLKFQWDYCQQSKDIIDKEHPDYIHAPQVLENIERRETTYLELKEAYEWAKNYEARGEATSYDYDQGKLDMIKDAHYLTVILKHKAHMWV